MTAAPSTRARTAALALTLSLAAGLAAGCDTKSFGYAGQPIPEFFPLDKDRSWTYRECSPDDSACVPSGEINLEVDKVDTRTSGDTEISTLTYSLVDLATEDQTPTLTHVIEWSSDTDLGVAIWSWTASDGTVTEFPAPIIVGEREMNTGDSVTTGAFTSTFVGLETCSIHWVPDPWECVHMRIEGDGSAPFEGDWWMASTWGASIMLPAGEDVPWVLAGATAVAGGE